MVGSAARHRFYALAALAPHPFWMFMCLLPAGICIGAIEQVVNLEADRVEFVIGRRIMNRAHAFWSIGFASAGLLGVWLRKGLVTATSFVGHGGCGRPHGDAAVGWV